MKLARIVVLHFRPAPTGWKSFRIERDGVVLKTLPVRSTPEAGRSAGLLVTAETCLNELPPRTANGCVSVPVEERRRLEAVIETTAATIAVSARCYHSISSACPSVAFVTENDDDRTYLDGSAGLDAGPKMRPGLSYEIEMSSQMIKELTDREEGIALLAEAFAHDRALGRYRELMRFFELAFALASIDLPKKLSQFLSGLPFGFTRGEVTSWCSVRHGAIHGDLKITPNLILEADVRPIVRRMEQAAMDVLFNKRTWHDKSRERRLLWAPIGGDTSPDGDMVILQGAAPTLTCQLFDAFYAYPLDLNANLTSVPQEWWCIPCTTEENTLKARESDPTPAILVE